MSSELRGHFSSLNELYWLAAGQICYAVPENGFNSLVLQIHYNIEIPDPLCTDAKTEGSGKAQIRNRKSYSRGC